MIAAILKEKTQGETRVAATPKTVKELIDNGLQLRVQSGSGSSSFHSDQEYQDLGAEIMPDTASTLKDAEFYKIDANWVFELPFKDSRVEIKSFTPLNFL